jgi:D-amino-acid oxidase
VGARPRAIVVGGGVSGLSVGVRLREAGFEVEVCARERAARSTSAVAAAIWYPYKAGPAAQVAAWSRAGYAVFAELARDARTGVVLRSGIELLPASERDSAWRSEVAGLRAARAEELLAGYDHGWVFQAPVIEMPIYLAWLERRLLELGGRLVEREVRDLAELEARAELVVNCTGLAARELCDDRELLPVRGQVVRVARASGACERFLLDDYNESGVTYVVPRSRDLVLGGSAEEGREDLDVDAAESAAIVARCAALEPALARAEVLSVGVGLRPYRPAVRVEREELGRAWLIHDYGHGGAGVTLSWGCADEVARLACEVFDEALP